LHKHEFVTEMTDCFTQQQNQCSCQHCKMYEIQTLQGLTHKF
jgi:hypothetical protein